MKEYLLKAVRQAILGPPKYKTGELLRIKDNSLTEKYPFWCLTEDLSAALLPAKDIQVVVSLEKWHFSKKDLKKLGPLFDLMTTWDPGNFYRILVLYKGGNCETALADLTILESVEK